MGSRLGTALILASAAGGTSAAEAALVQKPYLGLAAVLFAIAVAFVVLKLPKIEAASGAAGGEPRASVWSHRHLVLGVVAIFVYVGGEVAIGSLLVNFMADPSIAGLPESVAGGYVSYYWGAAMVGRFVGAAVMWYVRPGRVLAFNAVAAVALLAIAMTTAGETAMWCVLAVGFCNSIMFPTIFALALQGLGKHTGEGSGVLCMAIVGGAIVPVVQGACADTFGLLPSFAVPLACYLYIFYYGMSGHRPRSVAAG